MLNRFMQWSEKKGKHLYLLCNETSNQLKTDDVWGISPGITFYFIIGFIPFLIFLINAILFFTMAEMDTVISFLYGYFPAKIAATLEADIQRIIAQRSDLWMWMGMLASLFNFEQGLAILVQASDMASYMSLEKKYRFFIINIKATFFSVGLVVAIMLSLGLIVFGEALVHIIYQNFTLPDVFTKTWRIIKYLLPFISLILYLTFFYIFAPKSGHPTFLSAIAVSTMVTIAWLAATGIYSWFMMIIPSIGEAYGPLMGLLVLFLWFRWITYIIIIGLCMLKVWAHRQTIYENLEETC